MLKGVLVGRLDRPEEALGVFDDVARRAAGVASSEILELKSRALLGKANAQLEAMRHEDAIETINLVLSSDDENPGDVRWRAHATRAKARVALGDLKRTRCDVEAVLTNVAGSDALPSDVLRALMALSIGIGAEEMTRLIDGSPARDLLLPLSTALRLELGESPRVALEVQEVAADIRRDLGELRQQRTVSEP